MGQSGLVSFVLNARHFLLVFCLCERWARRGGKERKGKKPAHEASFGLLSFPFFSFPPVPTFLFPLLTPIPRSPLRSDGREESKGKSGRDLGGACWVGKGGKPAPPKPPTLPSLRFAHFSTPRQQWSFVELAWGGEVDKRSAQWGGGWKPSCGFLSFVLCLASNLRGPHCPLPHTNNHGSPKAGRRFPSEAKGIVRTPWLSAERVCGSGGGGSKAANRALCSLVFSFALFPAPIVFVGGRERERARGPRKRRAPHPTNTPGPTLFFIFFLFCVRRKIVWGALGCASFPFHG